MSKCIACGAELEPPVRVPHTVYVKTLYRIGGQDYCRHHIIRAAVAAGVIAEVKAGAGPVVAMNHGTSPCHATASSRHDTYGTMDAIILPGTNPSVGMELRKPTRRPSRPPAHLSPPERRRFRVDPSSRRADGGRHGRLRRRQGGTAIKSRRGSGGGHALATRSWIP